LLHASDEEHPFEQWYMGKSCFSSKKMLAIHDLILWSENCRIRKRNKEIPSILYRNVP
jgi:hypothetical protein